MKLIQADAVAIARGLEYPPGTRVITDPPYGNKSYEPDVTIPLDFYVWLLETFPTVALFGYPEKLVSLCVDLRVKPDEWITWYPTNKAASHHAKSLPRSSEHIAIFGEVLNAKEITRKRTSDNWSRKRANQRGLDETTARLGDVWDDPSPGMGCNSHLRKHPNEKPLSLMTKLVTLCSNEGETVFDPFMGSGTTGEAAFQLGRDFIGIEKLPAFFKVAEKDVTGAGRQTLLAI